MTETQFSLKKILISGGVFVLLIGLTLFVLLKDLDMALLKTTLQEAKPFWIIVGTFFGFVFVCCEGINVGRVLRLLGCPCSFKQSLYYGMVGFFFSSITPSASGGQPVQLYCMAKDRIPISSGTLSLLLELCSYQVISVLFAIVAFFTHAHFFQAINSKIAIFLCFGVGLNLCVLVFILAALFSRRLASSLVNATFGILKKMHIKKAAIWQKKAVSHLEEYKAGAVYIRKNPWFMLRTLAITAFQFLAFFSIPFVVYKAFGLSGYSWSTIFSMQAVLYIAVSAIPLPGSVGITEGIFLSLFQKIFTASTINAAVLLSRWESFYFVLLICGIALLISYGRHRMKRRERI